MRLRWAEARNVCVLYQGLYACNKKPYGSPGRNRDNLAGVSFIITNNVISIVRANRSHQEMRIS